MSGSTGIFQDTSNGESCVKNVLETQAEVEDANRIIDAAIEVLVQGERLVNIISPSHFSLKIPAAFNASIGQHYRHCLDHFNSFLRGLDQEVLDYDHRDRNPLVEGDPMFALEVTRRIKAAITDLQPDQLNRQLLAQCEVSYSKGNSPRTHSSTGRELVYTIAHAIHHYALIGVMARLMDIPLPPNFGVAPSTVTFLSAKGAKTEAH